MGAARIQIAVYDDEIDEGALDFALPEVQHRRWLSPEHMRLSEIAVIYGRSSSVYSDAVQERNMKVPAENVDDDVSEKAIEKGKRAGKTARENDAS